MGWRFRVVTALGENPSAIHVCASRQRRHRTHGCGMICKLPPLSALYLTGLLHPWDIPPHTSPVKTRDGPCFRNKSGLQLRYPVSAHGGTMPYDVLCCIETSLRSLPRPERKPVETPNHHFRSCKAEFWKARIYTQPQASVPCMRSQRSIEQPGGMSFVTIVSFSYG